jgi:hypothetical protein
MELGVRTSVRSVEPGVGLCAGGLKTFRRLHCKEVRKTFT